MIAITKYHHGKPLRIFIEEGVVLFSAKDMGRLINDKNPGKRLERAGVLSARYRRVATKGGVQKVRLVTLKECLAVFSSLRTTVHHEALLGWFEKVVSELSTMKCDFCGGC